MKVLVILEDPTLDEHIALPVLRRLFEDLGRRAQVRPLREPHLRGIAQALDASMLRRIVDGNRMEDLFLLVVDRDCDRFNSTGRAAERENEFGGKLIACVAVQELECWMLALHKEAMGASWAEVRAHCDPKEAFAEPFLRAQGGAGAVGGGRKRVMQELSGKWASLLGSCPELVELKRRLQEQLDA